MKAFSPAGPCVKAFFGYGAKTFGNPQGATSGSGGPDGRIYPPPPRPPPAAPNTVYVGQDYINVTDSDGLLLSTLLTNAGLLAAWEAGTIPTLNIVTANNPPRGYWIITGGTTGGATENSGFNIDVLPAANVTINWDMSQVRVYGPGGSAIANGNGLDGGTAIAINAIGAFAVNLNLTLITGAGTGKLFGGGGGGSGPSGTSNAGGGAGGYFGGLSAGTASAPGVYDPVAGGAQNPNVAGGVAGASSGNGGGLGAAGSAGTGGNAVGAGGFAVNREGFAGVTVIVTGNNANNVRGVVQ